MLIFETIGCPMCSGKIAVVVENNVITSHGVCPGCDNAFSAERLMFTEKCKAFEDEFMETMEDVEVCDYCQRWYTRKSHDESIYACPGCVATRELFLVVDEEVQDFYKLLWKKFWNQMYKHYRNETCERLEYECPGCPYEQLC